MRIPESTINNIRNNSNIVDVVGNYVRLRRKGKNYWGLCPFHGEKTPSFSVHEEKQIFHCFGCHVGGDVFKFLREYRKISYVEAVQEIAAIVGIPIIYEQSSARPDSNERELLYDLNESVAEILTAQLNHPTGGKAAMEYLRQRGMTAALIRSFRLGFSPPNRKFLVDRFAGESGKTELALELGLIGKSDTGNLYDRFAGRIIFPIFSTNGRVVAFAGRVFQQGESGAKYVNSPESKIYTKGKILYGLSHGKEAIRQTGFVLVVEGYMDLISLHNNGIKNVIAVSGTALTDDQAVLLSRFTKDTVLLFDADEAGVKASLRSVEILLKRDLNIRIASLPAGEDPDSFIRANAASEFEKHINNAASFLEFQTGYYDKQGLLRDPVRSAEIIHGLIAPLALISDKIKQQMLLKSLAERFQLRERMLEDELSKIILKSRQVSSTVPRQDSANREAKPETPTAGKGRAQFELELIKILLQGDRDVIEFILSHVSEEEIVNERHRKILNIINTYFSLGGALNPSAIIGNMQDETLQHYASELTCEKYTVGEEEWEKKSPLPEQQDRLLMWAYDVLRRIKVADIEQEIAKVKAEVKSAERAGKEIELLHQVTLLQKQKTEVRDFFTYRPKPVDASELE